MKSARWGRGEGCSVTIWFLLCFWSKSIFLWQGGRAGQISLVLGWRHMGMIPKMGLDSWSINLHEGLEKMQNSLSCFWDWKDMGKFVSLYSNLFLKRQQSFDHLHNTVEKFYFFKQLGSMLEKQLVKSKLRFMFYEI